MAAKENIEQQAGPRARYRKIEVRMWGDEKFRALSPIAPSGQALWVFLLTGPHTGPIPGIFRAGRAALAEELDWPQEAFDEAFREAFQQGMVKADWKAKVVWIPNAIKCNKPESPNVVRSWATEWSLIPQCDLKDEAFESLKANIHGLSEAFGKAFDMAFGKPSTKPSPKACGNQEQQQQQEQKEEKPLSGKPDASPPKEQKKPKAEPLTEEVETVLAHLNERAGKSFRSVPSNTKLISARLETGATVEQCKAVIDDRVRQWRNDPKMAAYLRPATLFNGTKFEQYLGQLGTGNGQRQANGHDARFEN